tara:strand:- start:1482 stop:2042 length:561 start_codon:yes stop_codon:yes gene_type:complete
MKEKIYTGSLSVIAMDYDLNVFKEYESLSKLSNDIGAGHTFNHNSLKVLHSGYVSSFYGRLIVLKRFYNKNLDFKYTVIAKGLCNRVESAEQQKAQLKFRNNYNRRVAILNDDFTIKESLMCTMKDLADKYGLKESTVKSHLFRAPERIFKIAINQRKHESSALIIHMTKYNSLISRIEEHRTNYA